MSRFPIRMRRGVCAIAVALAHGGAGAVAATTLNASTREPRAFGYQVGDVMSRTVTLHAPDGLRLDESSVPKPGARGKALELRSVARRSRAEPGGRREELTLEYQVFLAPAQTRTLELPPFALRFQGLPRAQDLRIDAWPVTVAPLVPVEVSPRRGLGELQPDAAPPLIDTQFGRDRLVAYGVALLALLGYLAHVYIAAPLWMRAEQPFAQAWRALRGMPGGASTAHDREAFRCLHEALNRTAGEAVFEPGIDRLVAAQPRFAPLRDELVTFLQRSRALFFAPNAPASDDRAWLLALCRRCRDAERGSA